MRNGKLFFIIFLVLYFIAGISLLITGSVAHRHASSLSPLTGYSLMSGAGFVIALGVLIIILSITGFIGALKNRLDFLQFFVASLSLIILLQFIASIVTFTLRTKAEDHLRQTMISSMKTFDGTVDVRNEWNQLQQIRHCCGVIDSEDWIRHGKRYPPESCCKNYPHCDPKNSTTLYREGCYETVIGVYYEYSQALGGVTLFFFFVEIAGFILAILLLRDLKTNLNNV